MSTTKRKSGDDFPHGNSRKRHTGPFRGGRRGGTRGRGRGGHFPKRTMSSGDSGTQKRQENDAELHLTEKDIGITEYISSSLPGFNGVIKQRYSDFLVNELKLDGTEVHLTDCGAPVIAAPEPSIGEKSDVLPQETWDKLDELLSQDSGSVEISVTKMNKVERTNIHHVVKRVYGDALVSNTKEANGEKIISIFKPRKDTPKRAEKWIPKGEYVHFTLFKQNMNTADAVTVLARNLRLRAHVISYAGTKDRRALTTQQLCIKKVEPTKIAEAASSQWNIKIGNFEFKNSPLCLGDLSGNRFQIVLRNVTATDEDIDTSLKSLKQLGFLNYYGLQRFGTQSVPTHHIGRALLLGNWQESVELILKPRGFNERTDLQEARRVWWETRDAAQALAQLSTKNKYIEGQLLHGLVKNHKNDVVNALESIPRNVRLMYLHSYQSFVWNHMLSRRIREFGLNPIVGDLVLKEKSAQIDKEDVLDAAAESLELQEVAGAAETHEEPSKLPEVEALTEETVGSFSLQDVVLPLPGYQVTYPSYASFWYEEFLAKDGLSSAALKQKLRKYSVAGAYRCLSVVPTQLSWHVMSYSDVTKQLVLSDLDMLENKPAIQEDKVGSFRALVLDFHLRSSVYATMLLREVLKRDTSSHHQSTLNNYVAGDGEAAAEEAIEPKTAETEEQGVSEIKSPSGEGEVKMEGSVPVTEVEEAMEIE